MKLHSAASVRLSAVLSAMFACEDGDTAVYLSSVIAEPASAECPAGGQRFRAGIDENRDGTLAGEEVRTSTLLCLEGAEGGGRGGIGDPERFDCRSVPYNGPPGDAVWRRELNVLGGGFLALTGNTETTPLTYYTRRAVVHKGADGCLQTELGLSVLGYELNARGMRLTDGPVRICVRPEHLVAKQTENVWIHANLDATATIPPIPFDPTNIAGSTNVHYPLSVYDSLGKRHDLRIAFNRTSVDSWEYHAFVDGGEIDGGPAGVAFVGASGPLTFDTDGRLVSTVRDLSSWNFVGAMPGQIILFDFGSALSEGGSGKDGTTNVAAPMALKLALQNGYAPGTLNLLRIGDDGAVRGGYTNLHEVVFAQIALATFPDATVLSEVCGGVWMATSESGEGAYAPAGTEGRGGLAVRMPE